MARRVLVALGLLAITLSSLTLARQSPARAAGITFATPTVMDPIHAVGEPTIVRSPAQDNTVYASGPWGTGTQRSIWDASADGGETFRIVNQCAPISMGTASCQSFPPGNPPSAIHGNSSPPGGGDTDQRLDSSGKDYFTDLWALLCDRVATTTDHGATAAQNAYGCNSPSAVPTSRPDGNDRPWVAVLDPGLLPAGQTSSAPDKAHTPLVYEEYNNLQTTQPSCSYWAVSTDGLNYSPANNDSGNFGCDGYPAIDQVTGKVFEASGCTVSNTPALCLNIGTPDSNGILCFLDDNGSETIGGSSYTCPNGGGLITVASGLAGDPDLLFTVASMDRGRNLHITYAVTGSVNPALQTSSYQVYTTVAPPNDTRAGHACTNCWTHWATPVQVSQSPANVNVFPWMIAGGPGRSDSVWYGTNSYIDPSTNGGQAWNVYMSQVVWPTNATTHAVTLAPPAVDMVKVSPHPNHYNSICLLGTGCITQEGDRNLADFFTVSIDHNGAADVEYDDTSNGLIQSGFTPGKGLFDHPGAPLVTIAHQDGGPGLFAGKSPASLANEPSNAPTTGMTDPTGDARYPVIGGTNQPAFDLLGNHLALSADDSTLTVTMKVRNLLPATMLTDERHVTGAADLQFITRWQMGNTIYYAMMETNNILRSSNADMFYAGSAQSIDLCSVSACDPHVLQYPETPQPGANGETGSVSCPATPTAANPCVITINIHAADVGGPTQGSFLEEVGSYALGSVREQSLITNADAEVDNLPLEVDGICCFNFGNQPGSGIPEAPWAPALLGAGLVATAAGLLRRRKLTGLRVKA